MGLFLLFNFSIDAQTEKNVKSNVKAVTVFLNRAQVINAAKIVIPAGTTNLVFEDLSTKIIKPSIQVTAKGNITIMSVKHQINYLRNQSKTAKIKQYEDTLENLRDKVKLFSIQRQNWQREEDVVLSNKMIGGDAGVNAQKLKEMADFYRARLTEIQTNLYQIDKELTKINLKINSIANQISEANRDASKPTSEILVTVTASTATTVDFELNYIVPDAGWTPIYDLRAKDAQSPIQLSYKANVFQNTGIDWKDVKVTLSTGNPAQGGVKPELKTWYVNFYNKMVSQNLRNTSLYENATRGRSNSPNADYKDDAKISKKEMEDVEEEKPSETIADKTEVTESTFATEFEISVPYTILSDGKPQLVDVKNYDVKTYYDYGTVPRMDFDSFLMARMTGWEQLNLLSGQANVYFEGSFVGETYLNANNVKDTLAISLGRDKKIITKRMKVKDISSRKFIGSNVKEELGFEIQVRNTKKTDISITVEEQIPISKDGQIDVELIEAKDAIINKATGRVTWKLTIKPNETKKMLIKYNLKYPKNRQIAFE
ncbi:MAG: mucoidy inhibitor MuiA family protein [Cytophagia bacterium]|nr:MAG: mucoidy inhibitor MuiA family protein [Cytophagales bacterium]TAG03072.1 MAG: mucoidy inhibitor MuiA family protein [Cytophagia bacterium]TAG42269.1 MAG: mucoidy inhibitor MuiA family protein [Cytophagia bacterium]TAH28611.1 MAG: mucoidy inhibitor MuiA family protein [Cytophagales bacterium]